MASKQCFVCDKAIGKVCKTNIQNPTAQAWTNLTDSVKDRIKYGDSKYGYLVTKLSISSTSTSVDNYGFHKSCYNKVIHKLHIKSLKIRYDNSLSSINDNNVNPIKRGRPLSPVSSKQNSNPDPSTSSHRTKRMKGLKLLTKSCIFRCENPCNLKDLYRIESDTKAEGILDLLEESSDEKLKISLSEITCLRTKKERVSKILAQELYYHKLCDLDVWMAVNRTVGRDDTQDRIRCLSNIQLVNTVKQLLNSSNDVLSISLLNDTYISILNRNGYLDTLKDYKRYIEKLIKSNLENIIFSSKGGNQCNLVCSKKTVGKSVFSFKSNIEESLDEKMKNVERVACFIRKELISLDKWNFEGDLNSLAIPSATKLFLSSVMFGLSSSNSIPAKEAKVESIMNTVYQVLVQNMKTDRQVNYDNKSEKVLTSTVQTPLSMGIALYSHTLFRSKVLVNTLTNLNIGCSYKELESVRNRYEIYSLAYTFAK